MPGQAFAPKNYLTFLTLYISKNRGFTCLGLVISYFSISLTRALHGGPLDDTWTVIREVIILLPKVPHSPCCGSPLD